MSVPIFTSNFVYQRFIDRIRNCCLDFIYKTVNKKLIFMQNDCKSNNKFLFETMLVDDFIIIKKKYQFTSEISVKCKKKQFYFSFDKWLF